MSDFISNLTTAQKLVILAVLWFVLHGKGTVPGGGTVTQVTYVWEKDQGGIPPAVLSALNKLNVERKILATQYEHDTKNGLQQIPVQYRVAVAASPELPSLVVQAKERVLKVLKAPKTEEEVLKGVP